MPDETTVPVWFIWKEVSPDPVQYKPYSPTFHPLSLAVQLDVPERFVVAVPEDHIVLDQDDIDYTVLTPEGAAWCMEQLSRGITNIKTGVSK